MAHKNFLFSGTFFSATLLGVMSALATPAQPPAQVPAARTEPAPSNVNTVVVTAQTVSDTPQAKGERDMTRVICRTRPVLGSRLSKMRECRTAAEWEVLRRQASNGADSATRSMTKGMVRAGN